MVEKIKEVFKKHISENSGFDTHRNYIGMSQVSRCQIEQFNNFFTPKTPTPNDYLTAWRGYSLEAVIKENLRKAGLLFKDSQCLAAFNGLYKGHTEGEWFDGSLLEIKTMNKQKFEKVKETQRLPYTNFAQIQEYLFYGEYKVCYCFVLCTETFEWLIIGVRQSRTVLATNFNRVKELIELVIRKQNGNDVTPVCTCGMCK